MDVLAVEMPSWQVTLFAFLFGAAWGSFFNVAIHRWPRGQSVVKPPSSCPHCNTRIPAYLNVPIVGFLILRGRTACCGQPLSPRYAVVEILGAVLAVAAARRHIVAAPLDRSLTEAALLALVEFAFCGGLLIATFVDLEHMEIPDEVSLPMAAVGLATASWRPEPGVVDAAIGAGCAYLVVQMLFVWGYEHLAGRRGMGEGDAKLMLMIGAFVGWKGAMFAVCAGSAQGLVVAVFALARGLPLSPQRDREDADAEASADAEGDPEGQRDEQEEDSEPPPRWAGHLKLPFGPFLALGALEYLYFGEQLTAAWVRLIERAVGLV